jgi:hypothetical protein
LLELVWATKRLQISKHQLDFHEYFTSTLPLENPVFTLNGYRYSKVAQIIDFDLLFLVADHKTARVAVLFIRHEPRQNVVVVLDKRARLRILLLRQIRRRHLAFLSHIVQLKFRCKQSHRLCVFDLHERERAIIIARVLQLTIACGRWMS